MLLKQYHRLIGLNAWHPQLDLGEEPMAESPHATDAHEAPNPVGPLIETDVVVLEGMLKEGHVRNFTVMCDEGARIGGTDTAPPPLGYFTLGVGF
jgi:hypothetical protein